MISDIERKRRRFVGNTILTSVAALGGVAVSTVLSFLLTPIFLRDWTVEGYGVFVLALAVGPLILAVGEMGFQSPMAKFVAQYLVAPVDSRRLGQLCGAMNVMFGGLGLGAGVLLAMLAEPSARWLGIVEPWQATFATAMRWAALWSAVSLASVSLVGFLEGTQRYSVVRGADVFCGIAPWVACLGLYMTEGLTVVAAIAAFALPAVARYLVLIWVVARDGRFRWWAGASGLSDAVSMARWLAAGKMSGMATKRLDPFIVNAVIGLTDVAHLNLIRKLTDVAMLFKGLTTATLVPFASQVVTQEGDAPMARLLVQGTRVTIIVVAGPVVALGLFAPAIYHAWVGASFEGLGPLAAVMLVWPLCEAALMFGSGLLHAKGEVRELVVLSLLNGATKLLLTVVLGFRMGLIGVVLSTVIATGLLLPAHVWLFRKYLRVDYRVFATALTRPLVVAVLLLAALAPVIAQVPPSIPAVAAGVAMTVLLYWALAFVVCLPATDQAAIVRYTRSCLRPQEG